MPRKRTVTKLSGPGRPKGDPGLRKAIVACGSKAELARRLKRTPQALAGWKKIPFKLIVAVERVSGVPREELAPSLYKRGIRWVRSKPA